jgi:hypothetical protein
LIFLFSTVSGTLTFTDGIGDTSADAITFSSNDFGESTATFTISPTVNSFTWTGNMLSSADLAARTSVNNPEFTFEFAPSANLAVLDCFDLVTTPLTDCAGDFLFSQGARVLSAVVFDTKSSPAVPLPAGLPLVLTGLAGFAGLRMRKKRKAQV